MQICQNQLFGYRCFCLGFVNKWLQNLHKPQLFFYFDLVILIGVLNNFSKAGSIGTGFSFLLSQSIFGPFQQGTLLRLI
jgi:hypothetical protein